MYSKFATFFVENIYTKSYFLCSIIYIYISIPIKLYLTVYFHVFKLKFNFIWKNLFEKRKKNTFYYFLKYLRVQNSIDFQVTWCKTVKLSDNWNKNS